MRLHRVVVGVDHSDASLQALRWATSLAAQHDAELTLVHAYLDLGPEESDPADDDRRALAARELDASAAAVPALAERSWRAALRPSRSAPALLDEARGADLLVIGARGAGGFEGLLLGATAEQCARHADCPVTVVPGPAAADARRIVVGVDGSPDSVEALRWAGEIAARPGDEIEAVTVYASYDAPGPFGGSLMRLASPRAEARFRAHAESALEHTLTRAETAATPVVLSGHPVGALLERGAGARMLVVGRRGAEGFPELRLGSVGRQLLAHSRVPVTIVSDAQSGTSSSNRPS